MFNTSLSSSGSGPSGVSSKLNSVLLGVLVFLSFLLSISVSACTTHPSLLLCLVRLLVPIGDVRLSLCVCLLAFVAFFCSGVVGWGFATIVFLGSSIPVLVGQFKHPYGQNQQCEQPATFQPDQRELREIKKVKLAMDEQKVEMNMEGIEKQV